MKVEWLYEAKNEYRDILTYYKTTVGRQSAERFANKILGAAGQLARFPASGVLRSDSLLGKYGFRALFVDQYVLIYRFTKETVTIYHLADARTNYLYRIFGIEPEE